MGEVLSQNEIDNLLAALSSGELDAEDMNDANDKQVKNYDFKRPTKFSKEHLRTLEIIYEHYGRLLSTSLPVYLRKMYRCPWPVPRQLFSRSSATPFPIRLFLVS